MSDNIDQKNSLWQTGSRSLDLVGDGPDVFLVKMFKSHERFPALIHKCF